MRIANVRIIVQAVFLALFVVLLYLSAAPRIAGYPVSVFLEADPFVGLTTALSTGHLYHQGTTGLMLGALILILTVVLGRAYCGWICPFGTLHHIMHWLGFSRRTKARLDGNRYRGIYQLKYWILGIMVAGSVIGVLQIGILDPIALLSRSMTDAVFPAVDTGLREMGLPGIHPSALPSFSGAWLVVILLVTFLGLNLVQPRFFCRVLCPLGALMGIFSRFSLFRIHRDVVTCTDCNLCSKGCEGASEPEALVRLSECMVCMNCLEDCPEGSISFRFLPPKETSIPDAGLGSRRAAMSAILGFFLFTVLRRSGGPITTKMGPGLIRPPGSLPEEDFLARCIKCDACIQVCPTNVLQPSGVEAGFESLWTPKLDMKVAYCDTTCTLCGHVCPTGSIERLTSAQRQGKAERPDGVTGPIIIGTASYDRGRCLPWAMDTPCVVCEEVCPVSPKAIFTREETVVTRNGETKVLKRPYIDTALCVGCGICEHECPISGPAAVRVGSRIVAI